MLAYIIYDKARINNNLGFADMLISAFAAQNVEAKLAYAEDYSPDNDGIPDIAVMRTVNYELSQLLEDKGVTVSNNSQVCRICNDKFLTSQFFGELGLRTMPTQLITQAEDFSQLTYPLVCKSRGGHGGSEVFWADNAEDLQACMTKMAYSTAIVQQPTSDLGKDMRVYVLGDEIIGGIMRTSDKDFRSNYSLGGKIERVKVPDPVAKIALKVSKKLNLDLGGVDFVYHKGKPVINEIEDVVGTRMLYAITDIDIVKRYVDYLIKKHKVLTANN